MKTRAQQHRLSRFVMRKILEARRGRVALNSFLSGIAQGTPAGWTDGGYGIAEYEQCTGDPIGADEFSPETRH